MRVKVAFVALISTVFAATLVKRDLKTITEALISVNSAADTFDKSIKSFDGSSGSISTFKTNSRNVRKAITTGTTNVQDTGPISIPEALSAKPIADAVIRTLNQTILDLIAKQGTFDSSGTSAVVLEQLQKQSSASQKLVQAIVSKVPSIASGVAQKVIGQIDSAFQRGIEAFQGSASSSASRSAPA